MVQRIMMNYRRDEVDDWVTNHIHSRLEQSFPGDVFFDRRMGSGFFPKILEDAARGCTVMISLVGLAWVKAVARLHDPEDWVRKELEIVLSRDDAEVVPVLFGGAKMPAESIIPESIRNFTRMNYEEISSNLIEEGIQKLLKTVQQALKKRVPAEPESPWYMGMPFRDQGSVANPLMIVIPAGGRFKMGSLSREAGRQKDEEPRHIVEVRREVSVSKYPITIYEWNRAVDSGFKADKKQPPAGSFSEREKRAFSRAPRDLFAFLINEWRGHRRESIYPVSGVPWALAKGYCDWLSETTGEKYRLLSEAEWEYCCRASTNLRGRSTKFSTGNTISFEEAHYNRNLKYRHEMKQINPMCWPERVPRPAITCHENAFNLTGMHGNVWEWVEDDYHPSYIGAPSNGSAWVEARETPRVKVVRGGCYSSGVHGLRSACRGKLPVTADANSLRPIGFRLARERGLRNAKTKR